MQIIKDKATRKSIIIGIITSVIVIVFINPLLSLGWRLVNFVASNTFEYFRDILYRNAALGKRNWIDVVILCIVLVPIFVFAVYQLKSLISTHWDLDKDSNEYDDEKEEEIEKSSKLRVFLHSSFHCLGIIILYAYCNF